MSEIVGHPLWPPPAMEDYEALAEARGISVQAAAQELVQARSAWMAREQTDPYRFGWEPTIWKVADALIDFPWCDEAFVKTLRKRFEWARGISETENEQKETKEAKEDRLTDADVWDAFKRRMRKALGFGKPVTALLILGGNRTGKSNYAAKRGQMMLSRRPRARVTAFHMSNDRSVEEQQPLFWHYMPPEWKAQVKGTMEYVAYKEKIGFSDNSFVNRIGSRCAFKNYEQDRATAIEGKADDLMLPDELVGVDWLETMMFRLTDRGGHAVATFTPLEGYSACVRWFLDGATTVRHCEAALLPRDGQGPDVAKALGLEAWELEELQEAEAEKRVALAPESRPEDCLEWLEDNRNNEQEGTEGTENRRVFERVARVARPVNPLLGVVFFHCQDNPYGKPRRVAETALEKRNASEVRVRCYGVAEKTFTNVLVKFSRQVHVVPDAAIPSEGTNYHVIDPAGDRNFFMGWIRDVKGKRYLYREWPGNYEIPGVGVPGPWAVTSSRLKGRNDGDRGEGTRSFGWGLRRYKFEIARLERWRDFEEWARGGLAYPVNEEEIEEWQDSSEVEPVETRIVDSRAASSPRLDNDRPVTLFEELQDMGLNVELAPGGAVIGDVRRADGIQPVISALDWNRDEPLSFFNCPSLYIAESCVNTIFAMETWMNAEGQKGATKDPIDIVRMFYLSEHAEGGTVRPAQHGFAYGRTSTSGANRAPRPGQSKLARWKNRRAVR